MKQVCIECNSRIDDIRRLTNELMNMISTDTLFATRHDENDLILFTGGTVCTNEFEIPCTGCDENIA